MLSYNWLAGVVAVLVAVLIFVTLALNNSGNKVEALEAEINAQTNPLAGDLEEANEMINLLASFNNLLIKDLEECQDGD